ncbi:MAG: SDR family NAD(P)-dependent oxidoreductase [Pseudomonadota bacterium]|nr:SDR family NAD(P)-dependent oxidoreductase [Pseudomonadota bacterium]
MTKRYLVTGGSGFLGAALVKKLLSEGHAVKVLDDNSRGAPRRLADVENEIEFYLGDIRDVSAVTKAAVGVDAIVHMAAINGTEFFYSKPEAVLDVSVRGMLSVIDACRANDIGDIVVASSSEAYQTPSLVPTPEEVPLIVPDIKNPRYSYGGGKIASELIAMNYGRNGFDRVTVFRPHNVYGPDMGWEHVVPQFAMRASNLCQGRQGESVDFPIKGSGTQTRAFVHVDDFTDGLSRVVAAGEHLDVYHIGTDEEVTISALAKQIVECFGCSANIIPSEAPAGETNRRCPDISKIRALGYQPSVPLETGLEATVSWYADNQHLMV